MKDNPPQETKKIGRPSGYSPEIGWKICDQIAEGKSLRETIKSMPGISLSMVGRWLKDSRFRVFREHYTRARAWRADIIGEVALSTIESKPLEFFRSKEGWAFRRRMDNLKYESKQIQYDKDFLKRRNPQVNKAQSDTSKAPIWSNDLDGVDLIKILNSIHARKNEEKQAK